MILALLACAEPSHEPRGRRRDDPEPSTERAPVCTAVTFHPDGGEPVDRSGAFGLGEDLVLDRPGTLSVCDGTWTGTLVVGADVHVVGVGADRAVLDGGGVQPVVVVEAGATLTLEGVAVVRGEGVDGGGIAAVGAASVTLVGVVLRENHARHQGGGLFAVGGPVVLEDVVFEDNDADSAGGGAFLREVPSLAVAGGTFAGNRAVGDGGGIRVHATSATFTGTTFDGNRSEDRGGALSIDTGADVVAEDVVLERSSAADRGGAVWVDDVASLELRGATVRENSASRGGGLAVRDSAFVRVAGGVVAGNGAVVSGGGLFVETGARVELDQVELSDNTAFDGAALAVVEAVATMTASDLVGNEALGAGGALVTTGPSASVTFSGGRVDANVARDGGGLFVGEGVVRCEDGAAILRNSAVSGGAAVVFGGTLAADGCDLGSGETDNEPADVHHLGTGTDARYGAAAVFTCDPAGCR